jgi:hypothetical protein
VPDAFVINIPLFRHEQWQNGPEEDWHYVRRVIPQVSSNFATWTPYEHRHLYEVWRALEVAGAGGVHPLSMAHFHLRCSQASLVLAQRVHRIATDLGADGLEQLRPAIRALVDQSFSFRLEGHAAFDAVYNVPPPELAGEPDEEDEEEEDEEALAAAEAAEFVRFLDGFSQYPRLRDLILYLVPTLEGSDELLFAARFLSRRQQWRDSDAALFHALETAPDVVLEDQLPSFLIKVLLHIRNTAAHRAGEEGRGISVKATLLALRHLLSIEGGVPSTALIQHASKMFSGMKRLGEWMTGHKIALLGIVTAILMTERALMQTPGDERLESIRDYLRVDLCNEYMQLGQTVSDNATIGYLNMAVQRLEEAGGQGNLRFVSHLRATLAKACRRQAEASTAERPPDFAAYRTWLDAACEHAQQAIDSATAIAPPDPGLVWMRREQWVKLMVLKIKAAPNGARAQLRTRLQESLQEDIFQPIQNALINPLVVGAPRVALHYQASHLLFYLRHASPDQRRDGLEAWANRVTTMLGGPDRHHDMVCAVTAQIGHYYTFLRSWLYPNLDADRRLFTALLAQCGANDEAGGPGLGASWYGKMLHEVLVSWADTICAQQQEAIVRNRETFGTVLPDVEELLADEGGVDRTKTTLHALMTVACVHAFWEGLCKHLAVVSAPNPETAFWESTYLINQPCRPLFDFRLIPDSATRLRFQHEVLTPLGLEQGQANPALPPLDAELQASVGECMESLAQLQDFNLTVAQRRISLNVLHTIFNCFKHRNRHKITRLRLEGKVERQEGDVIIGPAVHLCLFFQFDTLSSAMGPFLLGDLLENDDLVDGAWSSLLMWLSGYVLSEGEQLQMRLAGIHGGSAAREACLNKYVRNVRLRRTGIRELRDRLANQDPNLSLQDRVAGLNRPNKVSLRTLCEEVAANMLCDPGIFTLLNGAEDRIMQLAGSVATWLAIEQGDWPGMNGVPQEHHEVMKHLLTWTGTLYQSTGKSRQSFLPVSLVNHHLTSLFRLVCAQANRPVISQASCPSDAFTPAYVRSTMRFASQRATTSTIQQSSTHRRGWSATLRPSCRPRPDRAMSGRARSSGCVKRCVGVSSASSGSSLSEPSCLPSTSTCKC